MNRGKENKENVKQAEHEQRDSERDKNPLKLLQQRDYFEPDSLEVSEDNNNTPSKQRPTELQAPQELILEDKSDFNERYDAIEASKKSKEEDHTPPTETVGEEIKTEKLAARETSSNEKEDILKSSTNDDKNILEDPTSKKQEPQIVTNQDDGQRSQFATEITSPPEKVSSTKEEKLVRLDDTREEHQFEPEPQEHQGPDDSLKLTATATKNYDACQTFQTAAGNSLLDSSNIMEFSKNYADDLLGQNDDAQPTADLADFELPPYSGSSSSGSEQAPSSSQPNKQPSPAKRKTSSSKTRNVSPPDLSAVQKLIVSSYSEVSHIFHWKKPIESGIVFSIGSSLIFALTFLSIISVVAYSALGVIFVSGLIRLHKTIMTMLNRSTETPIDHIWVRVQNLNVSLSPEKVHELVNSSLGNLNSSLTYFKQVLLVEDKFATLKFGVFLYILTYIGALFNGMTIITLSYLGLFTIPLLYEKNKTSIDGYLNIATNHLTSTTSTITAKVSGLLGGGTSSASSQASAAGSKKQN